MALFLQCISLAVKNSLKKGIRKWEVFFTLRLYESVPGWSLIHYWFDGRLVSYSNLKTLSKALTSQSNGTWKELASGTQQFQYYTIRSRPCHFVRRLSILRKYSKKTVHNWIDVNSKNFQILNDRTFNKHMVIELLKKIIGYNELLTREIEWGWQNNPPGQLINNP